jgi:hypothetical protein
VGWSTLSVYGVKLHLLCATNRVPLSYELTAGNYIAEVKLTEELLAGTASSRRTTWCAASLGI